VALIINSGLRCTRGSFIPDAAEPSDDLVFPIAIAKSVGAGAPNDATDVRTIQQALNRFPDSMGGPQPKLDPDGKVGRLTTGAIEKFQKRQLGFTDFRIDPNKTTINRINELALTVFVTVNPRTMKKVYDELLPEVQACVVAADAALLSARQALLSPPSGIKPGAASAAVVNRHFLLDQNPDRQGDFELISGLFRNMLALVHRNTSGNEKTFVPAPGRFNAARMLVSGVLAMARSNGVALKGFDTGKAQDGSDVQIPRDKIMIMVPFAFTTRDGQIMTLIHEMAHFLGDADGARNSIDDPPGGSSAPSEIAKLPSQRRPRIAENYATFAFEARFRRPPLRILV
jgi:hypothetical protein